MEVWLLEQHGLTTEAIPALRHLIWLALLVLMPHLVLVYAAVRLASKGRGSFQRAVGLALYSYLLGTVLLCYSGPYALLHAACIYLPLFALRAWLGCRDKQRTLVLTAVSGLASLVAWQILLPALVHWEG